MIANTNDGTTKSPYLRKDLSMTMLLGLPDSSAGPKAGSANTYDKIAASGYAGIQVMGDVPPGLPSGLNVTGMGMIQDGTQIMSMVQRQQAAGCDCATFLLGTSFDDEDGACRLIEALLDASSKLKFPLYLETHRATITQDIWRTLRYVEKFPELRFNGDFSHWYTGHELPLGNINAKFEFMQPIFERTRFLHGRVGTPGCIQTRLIDRNTAPFLDHFREMWKRSFTGFLKSAKPGDFMSFTAELLPARVSVNGVEHFIAYAREMDSQSGPIEESDRWLEADFMWEIAKSCFEAAKIEVGLPN